MTTHGSAAAAPVRRVRAGDTVQVVSPCSGPDPDRLRQGMELLRGWGLVPTTGTSDAFDRGSGERSAADRAAEFQTALSDPEVAAVLVSRAGNGAADLVPLIDFAVLEKQPKPVCGFSDVTYLHAAVAASANRPTFHTPELAWNARLNGSASAHSLRDLLMGPGSPTVASGGVVRSRGPAASGRLRGGNLSVLVDVPPPVAGRGDVLFLEELRESPACVAEMLAAVTELGHTAGIAAVVLGQFEECGDPDELRAVLDRWCDGVTETVLAGVPAGHGHEQRSLALGWPVVVEPAAAALTYVTSPTSADVTWN